MSYIGNTKIGKMYLGNTEIAKAYLGNSLVYQKGSGPEPTNISYIRGGGDGSYIDTGITPDETTKLIIWARNFTPYGEFLFGARASAKVDAFGIGAASGTAVDRIRFDFATGQAYVDNSLPYNMVGYHKYEISEGKFYVDDTVKAVLTNATFSCVYNIHLFGLNNGGTHGNMLANADICACKIYKNNVLVRDYTAVNSPSVGLYDSVSNTLFTNAGGGSFSYGTFNENAYAPLQYITCSALQYIDTGIAGGYSLPIVAKVSPNASAPKWNIPISARYDTSKRCEFFFGNTTTANSTLSCGLSSSTSGIASSGAFANVDIVLVKKNNVFTAYRGNAILGSQKTISASASYTTGQSLIIGGTFGNGEFKSSESFEGKIYYVGSGSDGNYVPALVNNVAGMYDTYNDVFYPSISGTAFIAGPEIRRTPTNYFMGRNLAIIGDSISTYNADGYKYDSYSMYYPYGEVNSVEYTYWKMLMNEENATLEVNLSYSGSCACSRNGYVSLNDRIGLIGNADTVIIALGTNDSAQSKPLGDYLYDTPYSELGETNFREAYIKGIKGLLAANPNVDIVCAIFSMNSDYRNSIKTIALHYGLKCIDCGNDYAKVQGVHPNIVGMQEIASHFLYD